MEEKSCVRCLKYPFKNGLCRYHYSCWLFGDNVYKGKHEYSKNSVQEMIYLWRDNDDND